MSEKEPVRWITVKGKHLPVYSDGSIGVGQENKPLPITKKQKDIEDSMRNSVTEHLYYLDAEGNEIIHAEGGVNEVDFDPNLDEDNRFNRFVERAVWDGKDIHTTHNHPDGSIFSPDDIESFVSLENKSLSAVLPKSGAYRLIREQPISQGTDERGVEHFKMDGTSYFVKDYTSEFSPKSFAKAYDKAYREVWNPMGDEITNLIRQYRYKRISREEYLNSMRPMDVKIATVMEKWLKENASKYGYKFIKE